MDFDDLMQAGAIGLIDAARNFDATQGASFPTYATIRIRGAMLDEVRRYDWSPRSHRRRMRDVSAATRQVEASKGREATEAEIAEAMGISLADYQAMLRDSTRWSIGSFEELQERTGDAATPMADGLDEPLTFLEESTAVEALTDLIETLPERERLVMSLYYDEEMNLKEIGAVLGVSESRVCQIHGQILSRIRSNLTEYRGD